MLKDPEVKNVKKTLPVVENLLSRLLSDRKCGYCEQKTKGARFIHQDCGSQLQRWLENLDKGGRQG